MDTLGRLSTRNARAFSGTTDFFPAAETRLHLGLGVHRVLGDDILNTGHQYDTQAGAK